MIAKNNTSFYGQLCSQLNKVLPVPIIILDSNEKILSYPCPDARDMAKIALKSNGSHVSPFSIYRHFENGIFICGILLLGKNTDAFHPYLNSFIHLYLKNTPHPGINLKREETVLVNQLSNSGSRTLNIASSLEKNGYTPFLSRRAILLTIRPSFRLSLPGISFKDILSEAMTLSSFCLQEDIYGFPDDSCCLIFKHESSTRSKLSSSLKELSSILKSCSPFVLTATVGSPYSSPEDLHESYREADFLLSHISFLAPDTPSALFIEDFSWEYLLSLLPNRYLDIFLQPFSDLEGKETFFTETIIALAKYNCNLASASAALNLHRNTLLQRFQKIKSRLDFNPLDSGTNRMAFRAYALQKSSVLHLHAGVVIQQGSILHRGLQKLADLLFTKSGGTLLLSAHTMSISGDNQMLFEFLTHNSLDMAVVFTSTMNSSTNGLSSVLELPFLFDEETDVEQVLNQVALPKLAPLLEAAGVRLLNIWTMGYRFLTSDTPLRKSEDMKNKTIRIMHNRTADAYFRSLGAFPVSIRYGKLKEALRSGSVTCQENPPCNILETGIYKYQPYLTALPYAFSTEALLVSSGTWKALSSKQREALICASKEATSWIYKEQATLNQISLNILAEKKNISILRLTSEETLTWKRAAAHLYEQSAYPQFLKEILAAKRRLSVET